MTTILAIDPGPEKSGWVTFNEEPLAFGIEGNGFLVHRVGTRSRVSCIDHLVIEMTESRGMPVGKTVHETTFWIGRFVEAFRTGTWSRLYRREVKLQLCGSMRAKDSNIRQVLIDRWGGKEKAIGLKKAPGPLYGVTGHVWQALGLAVAWWELNGNALATMEVTDGD